MKYVIGKERIYSRFFENRKDIVRWDVLSVKKEQEIEFKFISTSSKFRQGVRIAVDYGKGEFEVNDMRLREFYLWNDTAPEIVKIKCLSQEGLISIYNVWETERKKTEEQMDFSGMLVERNGNKITYRCNNGLLDTNFDELVFEIELL